MKASELRIGNLLEFSNGIQPTKTITVGSRFFSSASIEKGDGDFEITPYYQRIKITGARLKELGFKEEFHATTEAEEFSFSKKDLTVEKYENQISVVIGNLQFKIEYIDQLQNLWFCLYHSELL